jgi:hypothetical protein
MLTYWINVIFERKGGPKQAADCCFCRDTLSARETFGDGEIDGPQLTRIITTKEISGPILTPFAENSDTEAFGRLGYAALQLLGPPLVTSMVISQFDCSD